METKSSVIWEITLTWSRAWYITPIKGDGGTFSKGEICTCGLPMGLVFATFSRIPGLGLDRLR
ncbi:hypothetical protein Sinac_1299 [Singulisphaera acidiphila DSM 18658]|uniref:Uncharacterized protein n=1 Tax=Singulisphaera acidiphila (strain ATCC BAA-1392 / DSM 18658 / VKM B-2454 / MOB10) TaxID=886293 RepID=L0D8X3_SINAD|nr:hypothetical protein Sinac_1299 [Singulisphaera acidiphila DSM 18658]